MSDLKRLVIGDHRDPREVLAELFKTGVPEAGSPPPEAVAWGRHVTLKAGVDPRRDPVRAIKVLRDRNTELGLRPARYLVSHL